MDIPKSIPVYLKHYIVEGMVKLNLWSGVEGYIDMTPAVISEPTREKVLKAINDGGYGCESIDDADVRVYAVYDSEIQNSKGSISVFVGGFYFMSDELVHAKRGV